MMNLILVILTSFMGAAEDKLKSLNNASVLPLTQVLKPKSLAVVYQADCDICHKQVADLKCLDKDTQIVLLGAFSSEKALMAEYK